MRATLSYPYVGDRFPELKDTVVVVKEIAELSGVPYTLLKNRMGMKRRRTVSTQSVFITDSDLIPRKRDGTPRVKVRPKWGDEGSTLSSEWLKRPLL